MSKYDIINAAFDAYQNGEMTREAYENMCSIAGELDEPDTDERFPEAYAEVDYGERVFYDPEAMDGARFDDSNFLRYYER